MPKYAFIDPSDPAPRRVRGWYDTDGHNHAALPAADSLVPVSDEAWTARLSNPSAWAVTARGKVVPL